MANKATATEKKTTATKPAAKVAKTTSTAQKSTTRTASRSKVSKGDTFACEVCGLTMIVDDLGDVAVVPDIICCEQTMKRKSSRTKAAKK